MLVRLRSQLIAYYVALLRWLLFHTTGRYVAWRLRRAGKVDVFLGSYDDRSMIFWPSSKKGKRVLAFALTRFPKKYGGYVVPQSQWRDIHDFVQNGWIIRDVSPGTLVVRTPSLSS